MPFLNLPSKYNWTSWEAGKGVGTPGYNKAVSLVRLINGGPVDGYGAFRNNADGLKGFPKGQLGDMLLMVYELKLNGLEHLIRNIYKLNTK